MAPLKNPAPQLKDIGEDGLIGLIRKWMKTSAPIKKPSWSSFKTITGIGDDTAFVQAATGDAPQALTTDMLVEGVHFLNNHPPELLGRKAVNSILSDLAAAGAWPDWIMLSLGAPPDLPVEWVKALYKGIRSALRPYGAVCLGGDCVRSEKIVINISAGGTCRAGSVLPLRSSARAGQTLYATGTLGDSGLGLWLLHHANSLPPDLQKQRATLIKRHRDPQPRVKIGIALARYCPDLAMMDLSDGLVADLPRIAKASKCGFTVYLDHLPISPSLRRVASHLDFLPDSFALYGGEDYELLFATSEPPENWLEKVRRETSERVKITPIGIVTSKEIQYLNDEGQIKDLKSKELGFQHF